MKVVIVSERRADYSRFKPILSLMKSDHFFDYRLIVTGISLLKSHGEDIKVIKHDGFKISAVVPMYDAKAPDTGAAMVRAYGRAMIAFADLFEKIKPDLILTGFDIGANFAATVVGAHMNIPVAHIQGGELTGSIDESLRHAMSKFAHIHFPATKDAAKRLRRIGEDPRFIFTVGCPSIDTLIAAPVMSRKAISKLLGIDPNRPYVIILQHPVTTEIGHTGWQFRQTLKAVKKVGVQGVIIYPNHDAGYDAIIKEIQHTSIKHFPSLSSPIFVNTMRYASALVGNSSSGIHETATLHVPTVNIGSRQQGRERPKNVIDVGHNFLVIARGLKKALFDKKFKATVQRVVNPYGHGHSAPRIIKILKHLDLKKVPIQKRFFD